MLSIWRYPNYCPDDSDEYCEEVGVEGVDFFRIPILIPTIYDDTEDWKPLPLRKSVQDQIVLYSEQPSVIEVRNYFEQVVPMKFWFGADNRPSAEEIMRSYPTYSTICHNLSIVPYMNLEQICEFETEFEEFRQYYIDKVGLRNHFWPPRPVFKEDLDKIADRKRELQMVSNPIIAKYYNYPIELSDEEETNGYLLYKNQVPFMDYDTYHSILTESFELQEDDEMFKEWLEEHCCSDWSKQDRHGECYGGFWRYPDGSYEKENAYMLSREDNIEGMLELPFPRSILKWSVIQGCNSRNESVRYSNFIGTWFERTREMLMKPMSLQEICKHELEKLKIALPNFLQ